MHSNGEPVRIEQTDRLVLVIKWVVFVKMDIQIPHNSVFESRRKLHNTHFLTNTSKFSIYNELAVIIS